MFELMYRCNRCQKIKGEGNKWLLVNRRRDGCLEISKWDVMTSQSNDIHHICGSECLQKELSMFLAETTIKEVVNA